MPDWLKAVLVCVALFVVFWLLVVKPTTDRVNMIHEYMGNNLGNDPTKWAGLTGNIRQNNEDVAKMLVTIRYDICVLQQGPGKCNPGPAGSPVKPPSYPP